ncbi:MAG: response regulator [Rhodothermales bacterium]|nr:response regulator [Rhodothermales bacterium]
MSEITDIEVLVVDDEDVVLGALARILSASGVAHRTTQSAEDALDEILRQPPDMLLADIKLPGKSGLDLVRICAERFPAIVSVCMTGYANAEHVLLSLESGAVDFVPKPFTVEEIVGTLTRAARLTGKRAQAKVPDNYYLLDGHSWLRPEDDGTVTLGLMPDYMSTLAPVVSIDVPAPNTMMRQGGVLTSITTDAGYVHRVWSAAGGRVEQANQRLASEPGLAVWSPFKEGWIASVMPTSLDDEIARLQHA